MKSHNLFYTILLPTLLFCFSSISQGSQIFYGSGVQTGGFQVHDNGLLHFNSPSAGIMYENTLDRSLYPGVPPGQVGAYVELLPSVAATELNHADGWFFETRVNSIQNTNTAGWEDYFGVSIEGIDDVAGASISLFPNGLRIVSRTVNDVVGTYTYSSAGYHTIRFESLANSMNGLLYVDGVKVLDVTLLPKDTSNGIGFYFGDPTSKSDGEAYWNYVAVNTNLSVPEPATYALMGIGLLGILAVQGRRMW